MPHSSFAQGLVGWAERFRFPCRSTHPFPPTTALVGQQPSQAAKSSDRDEELTIAMGVMGGLAALIVVVVLALYLGRCGLRAFASVPAVAVLSSASSTSCAPPPPPLCFTPPRRRKARQALTPARGKADVSVSQAALVLPPQHDRSGISNPAASPMRAPAQGWARPAEGTAARHSPFRRPHSPRAETGLPPPREVEMYVV